MSRFDPCGQLVISLWMLHTMDYQSRDNITNWLLRAFSIFGLATVMSGFTLFFLTQKKKRR
ncbi:MAG: hypothetical protein KF852_08025 [Saprospiraceae bacterium]|nr:hypothetical protein [Saprospiraceae bacterium]